MKTVLDLSSAINRFAGVRDEARAIRSEVDALASINKSLLIALESNRARPNSGVTEDSETSR